MKFKLGDRVQIAATGKFGYVCDIKEASGGPDEIAVERVFEPDCDTDDLGDSVVFVSSEEIILVEDTK